MTHNAAELQKNVRTAWVKPFKNGGQKANWLRQAKERRKVAPCVIYRGIAAQVHLNGEGVNE